MHRGWSRGVRLYVNGRPGTIKSKRGDVWTFQHDGETRTTKIHPSDTECWYYDIKKPLNRWPGYLSVILIQKSLKPFVYKRESYGAWHGATTARTIAADLPVWQIAGTNRLLVGHLGEYRAYSKTEFLPVRRYQQDVWIGKGQPGKKFRNLKVAEANPPQEPTRKGSVQLYAIPSREELG